jgi:hypothetical protein
MVASLACIISAAAIILTKAITTAAHASIGRFIASTPFVLLSQILSSLDVPLPPSPVCQPL